MAEARVPVPHDKIETFCRKWKVKELSLFGSVLTNEFLPESDVDVLVELHPRHGLTLYDWLDMIEDLKAIFGRNVDLIAKSGLKNPIRRREILRTAEVLYAA